MYNERMLVGDLSPPLTSGNMEDWPDQAPFVLENHEPRGALVLLVALRRLPSLGVFMAGFGYSVICVMAGLSDTSAAVDVWTLMPGIVLALLAIVNLVSKRLVQYLDCCPATPERVSALKARAARHDVAGPMTDAQARTSDCWRVGHVRQAHAVLDRMDVVARHGGSS
ncbi:hypothetical protein S4A8_14105 [Salinisphaera sp. S4-8]|uniref:hypothetical protein n=1 Tax=Salinisphaera sp. S4-8 TaxID=633357 RepID=UPI003340325B